jgi:hypothetical protein
VKRNTAHVMGKHVWDSIPAYNRYEGRRDETLDVYLSRVQDEYHLFANPPKGWFHWLLYCGVLPCDFPSSPTSNLAMTIY